MKTINLADPGGADIPEHFPHEKTRSYQNEAIKAISEAWDSGYKYVFLEAPTGFGKSAIAITMARRNAPAYILVSTKSLQKQYVNERDFKTSEVKGRGNFRCMKSPKWACNAGDCMLGIECDNQPSRNLPEDSKYWQKLAETGRGDSLWIHIGNRVCRYWKQKCRGLNHKYPVLNYDYFLCESTFSKDFGKRKLIICDEAHNIENCLMRFIGFSLSGKDLELINSKIPKGELSVKEWLEEIREWHRLFLLELKATEDSSKGASGERRRELMLKLTDLKEKIKKLEFLTEELSEDPENWVVSREKLRTIQRIQFKPIFVKKWAKEFFDMADKFLLQSATLIDPVSIAQSLDLPEDECIFIRVPSTFDPENRPFYYIPVGRMSKRNLDKTLPMIIQKIKKIMSIYPDTKGVIHTHSYLIQDYIMKNICSDRLIFNRDAVVREDIFREFRKSPDPMILVTPSAYEGVDFKHDICRWQIICKVPYPFLGDPQVSKRKELDPRWYEWNTILRLIQTYGRGMRAHDDFCNTFMLDECFALLYKRRLNLFPEWFREAIKWEE